MQLRSTHLGGLVLICFVNFTGLIDFIIIYLFQLNTKRNILVANVMRMQLKDQYKDLMWFKTIFIDVKCIKNLLRYTPVMEQTRKWHRFIKIFEI